MQLLILEALGAFVLLLLIVWWTMFSGRKGGELTKRTTTEGKNQLDISTDSGQPKS